MVFCFILIAIMEVIFSYCRAIKKHHTHIKHGMVYDIVNKQLIGTSTEVHTDPKTGTQFLGKTTYTKNN